MRSPGMSALSVAAACAVALCLCLSAPRAAAARPSLPDPPAVYSHAAAPTVPQTSTHQLYLPHLVGPTPPRVLIAAAHIDSALSYEPDEAILLWNAGGLPQPLAGWQLEAGTRRLSFPVTTTLSLAPGARLWCAKEAALFRITFGEPAACEWDEPTEPQALLLSGKLSLTNKGGFIRLRDAHGVVRDTLLYGEIHQTVDGWDGPPAQLYARGALAKTGQVWQRKRHPLADRPMDTDRAVDWASDPADLLWGRRIRRPGWQGWTIAERSLPVATREEATTTVAVGPDGLYAAVGGALSSARSHIDLSIYTLEHPDLTALLVERLDAGVAVRLLLEGSPPGGISDLQKWCVTQLAAAGAQVRYLAVQEDAPRGYKPRYSYAHAKYALIDDAVALVGTDNFNRDSMPVPGDQHQGGRRGYYLVTDAAGVVQALAELFDADWQPERFLDLAPYHALHEKYGAPPAEYLPEASTIYPVDEAPFVLPTTETGMTNFVVIAAPENALRPDSGLFALIDRTRAGDSILVEQLYEHKNWGDSLSNPIADPNPRLEALLDAARRGVQVRILLDSFFDDGEARRSNRATVEYVRAVAAAEGLDLDARLGNPTGGGIHAKLMLLTVEGVGWSAVGSLNGGEVSHKANREVLLITDAPAVHARLVDVFDWDWARSE